MTNIGTLFYILWFLGTTFSAFGVDNTNLTLGINDKVLLSDTLDSPDFSISTFKNLPNGISKIVIDAGHGGHDHGCTGDHSNEKNITLGIALKLGQEIKSKYPEIEVLYTRSTDVFVPLYERIALANKNDADIFLSIHANAFSDQQVSGTEVFVMGLHTAEENLRVAKRENASVLLESDFEKNYDGFDPNSPEAQIILSMYQNVYLDKSISLAEKISDRIAAKASFVNRGVKQAGFVILRKATMPSVLIESGFLSNQGDEDLLKTDHGQQLVAEAIANAIARYKNEVEQELQHMLSLKDKTKNFVENKKGEDHQNTIIYRVQLGAYSTENQHEIPDFIADQAVDVVIEDGLKKMIAGKFPSYELAKDFLLKIHSAGKFKQSFIVAYLDGQRIGINQAREIKQSRS